MQISPPPTDIYGIWEGVTWKMTNVNESKTRCNRRNRSIKVLHFANYCTTNVQMIKLGIGTTNLNNRFVLSLASFLVGEEKALQSLPSLEVRKSTNHQVVIKLASFSKSSLELIWVKLFQFTSETGCKNYTINQVTWSSSHPHSTRAKLILVQFIQG